MENIETTPKRGRPAKTIDETNTTNRRNEVALAVLTGVVSSGVGIDNKWELSRWCYEMADAFIEVGNETD